MTSLGGRQLIAATYLLIYNIPKAEFFVLLPMHSPSLPHPNIPLVIYVKS